MCGCSCGCMRGTLRKCVRCACGCRRNRASFANLISACILEEFVVQLLFLWQKKWSSPALKQCSQFLMFFWFFLQPFYKIEYTINILKNETSPSIPASDNFMLGEKHFSGSRTNSTRFVQALYIINPSRL